MTKVAKSFHSPTWVRSWDTDVSVQKSSVELETVLRRYHAKGFTVSVDYVARTLVISFTMPRTWHEPTDETVTVQLMVGFSDTLARLKAMDAFQAKHRRMGYGNQWASEQAERVAWRQIILWVEAGLNMAASGVQTIEEAFFAHTILPGSNARVIDAVNAHRQQLLQPPGTPSMG